MKNKIVLLLILFFVGLAPYTVNIAPLHCQTTTTVPALTEDTSPTSDDLVYTINDPAGTVADRKVTLSNLPKAWGTTLAALGYTSGVTSNIQTQLDAKQPLDADLTTYAGITPSANAQTLLTRTFAQMLSDIGAQAADADLTTYAGITPSANVQSVLGAADYAAIRTLLTLVIGTNVQAYDADLATYAGITPSANAQTLLTRTFAQMLSDIGAQAADADLTTYAGITPSANVQSVLSAADYAAIRTLLTLVIGTNVQAYDADLTTYAGITPTANVQSVLGAADYAAIRTLLTLVIGTNVQAYDADLTTYAGITPTANVQSVLGAADYAAIRTLLTLVIGTNVQAYDADLTTYAGITPSANVQALLAAADYAAFKVLLSLNSVENTALSTWTGSSSITTLGTIGTGSWNATNIAIGKGGTGAALTDPNANRLWGWDDTDGAITWITMGTGLSYDHSSHTLTATGSGYGTIQEEGSNLTQRTIFNIIGGGITAADDAGNSRTNITLDSDLNDIAALACADNQIPKRAGGVWTCAADETGAGGGYTTAQEEGVGLTQRSTINFVGSGVTAADDAGNTRTNVTLASILNAVTDLSSTGLIARTGAGTVSARTITGDTEIVVSQGDGVAGNPTLSIAAAITRDTELTTHAGLTTGAHGITGTIVGTSETQTLTNKTLTDSTTTFQDNLDNTKKFQFQVSGLTTGQTRIVGIRDMDGTMEYTGHSHTASNVTDFNEAAQDTIGGSLQDTTTINSTYTDAAGTIEFAVIDNTNIQKVTVRKNTGVDVGSRKRLNLIEGSNVTLTIADDGTGDEVDVTIAAPGASGYNIVQEEGTPLTQRTTLNFVGAGFTAADDAGNTRTNLTLDTDLNTIASLTPVASKVMIGAAGPVWAVSAWTIADPGAANAILASDGTNWARVTTFTGNVTGNASTASALAANGANCSAGQIALGVDASGVAECTATPSGLTSVGATTFTGALTGNASTASALANNGANCTAGEVAMGVNASGVAECTATPSVTNITGALIGNASTASALAGDPTDCSAGTMATAIAASGNLTCGASWAAPAAIGTGTPAAGTFTTLSAGAGGFSIDPDGDMTVKSLVITKVSGSAGDLFLYEANSTDTDAAGFRGPDSMTANTSYRGKLPNARATSANMVLAWTNAGETGTGTPADPYVQAMSYVDLDGYALASDLTTHTGDTSDPHGSTMSVTVKVQTPEVENASGNITIDAINAAANSTVAIGNSAATYVANVTVDGNLSAATYGSSGTVTDAELLYVADVTSAIQAQLDARCLESVFGTAIGTGLILDSTTLKTHAALQSIAGLTEADVSILEATADNTYAVVTSGGGNRLLGSNAGNTALEFKSTLNIDTLDMASATSSTPWPVGTATWPTTEGGAKWDATNDVQYVGSGAASMKFGPIDDTATNGNTNRTWSADKIYDDLALKAPLASPVFTTSLALPANGTVDAAGEITVDTTTDQLRYYGGAERVLPYKKTYSVVIPSVAATDDMMFVKLPYGITVTALDCIVSAATSATINIVECNGTGTCTDEMATADLACDTDGTTTSTFGGAAGSGADSGDWLQLKVESISGTPGTLTVTLTYSVVGD